MKRRKEAPLFALVGAALGALTSLVAWTRPTDPGMSLTQFVATCAAAGTLTGVFLSILQPWRRSGTAGFFGAWIVACSAAMALLATVRFLMRGDQADFYAVPLGAFIGLGLAGFWKTVTAGLD